MITIPENCPCCNSVLERIKDQLFCKNSSCDATSSKQLLHFVKTMKIKGMGEKTLEKLKLESISEIYEISKEKLKEALGDKIGEKLYDEITNSQVTHLSRFISSFGIPLVGNTASDKIAIVTESLWNINKDLCKKAGLGDKVTNNLLQWVKDNKELYKDMPITFIRSEIKNPVSTKLNVVITGKLDKFSSRTKAKEYLQPLGIKVVSTLSSNTDYLVCDVDSSSSSFKKAEKLNIPIITMNNLLNILKET